MFTSKITNRINAIFQICNQQVVHSSPTAGSISPRSVCGQGFPMSISKHCALPLILYAFFVKAEEKPAPFFGALQNTPARLEQNRRAGMDYGILELEWTNFYLEEGVKNTAYIQKKQEKLRALRELGYQVMLGFGTQYPPQWIFNRLPHGAAGLYALRGNRLPPPRLQ